MSYAADVTTATPPTDMRWDIVPKGFLSQHFQLRRNGEVLATLRMAFCREQCDFDIAGHSFAIRRPSLWKDSFQLIVCGDETDIVCDVNRKLWSRRFDLVAAERRWVLQPAGYFTRTYLLMADDRQVGSIRPAGWFTRRRNARFTAEVPPPIQVLAIFLVLIVSRRQQTSGG